LSDRPLTLVFDFNTYNAVLAVVDGLRTEEAAAIWSALTAYRGEAFSPTAMTLRKECGQRINEDTREEDQVDAEASDQ
jgi:hypothetical protein